MILEGIVWLLMKVRRGTRYVPSENVFVDRAMEWTTTCYLTAQIDHNVAPGVGVPACVIGKDIALTAFPLNSLCQTLTATINDKEML